MWSSLLIDIACRVVGCSRLASSLIDSSWAELGQQANKAGEWEGHEYQGYE